MPWYLPSPTRSLLLTTSFSQLTRLSMLLNKLLVVVLPWAVVILCVTGYITVITSLLTLLSVLCCLTCIRALALSAMVKHMQQLHENGVAPVNLVNMHLALLERDFTERDYEALLELDCDTPTIHPVTDAQLASLPVHRHVHHPHPIAAPPCHPPRGVPRTRPMTDAAWKLTSALGVQVPSLPIATQLTPSTKHAEYASSPCCVCLESYAPEQEVVTLPSCGHQFHNQCIVTWIKCRGTGARCPLCNARVFTCQGTCAQGV